MQIFCVVFLLLFFSVFIDEKKCLCECAGMHKQLYCVTQLTIAAEHGICKNLIKILDANASVSFKMLMNGSAALLWIILFIHIFRFDGIFNCILFLLSIHFEAGGNKVISSFGSAWRVDRFQCADKFIGQSYGRFDIFESTKNVAINDADSIWHTDFGG